MPLPTYGLYTRVPAVIVNYVRSSSHTHCVVGCAALRLDLQSSNRQQPTVVSKFQYPIPLASPISVQFCMTSCELLCISWDLQSKDALWPRSCVDHPRRYFPRIRTYRFPRGKPPSSRARPVVWRLSLYLARVCGWLRLWRLLLIAALCHAALRRRGDRCVCIICECGSIHYTWTWALQLVQLWCELDPASDHCWRRLDQHHCELRATSSASFNLVKHQYIVTYNRGRVQY